MKLFQLHTETQQESCSEGVTHIISWDGQRRAQLQVFWIYIGYYLVNYADRLHRSCSQGSQTFLSDHPEVAVGEHRLSTRLILELAYLLTCRSSITHVSMMMNTLLTGRDVLDYKNMTYHWNNGDLQTLTIYTNLNCCRRMNEMLN